jgi:hypothetical protein
MKVSRWQGSQAHAGPQHTRLLCRRSHLRSSLWRCEGVCVRVRVRITGSQKCRIIGESQPVLVMSDPIISTRTHIGACVRASRAWGGGDQQVDARQRAPPQRRIFDQKVHLLGSLQQLVRRPLDGLVRLVEDPQPRKPHAAGVAMVMGVFHLLRVRVKITGSQQHVES